jgi:Asp-tRNA(Asn)/Glu-tRNA(Gln) amidotransferase A subunit family amidase
VREPLHRLPATKLAQMIAIGEASPETVTRSYIDAIREREHEVQAFAWFDADHALAAARMLHLVSRRGHLHGLPFAVKDNIDTSEMPTGYGSPIYDGHRPDIDAICVAQLKGAGAFVLGKTVSAELANFTPGPTRNPHNPAHTPGGSSSGSAAAVAAHFTPFALGTQTAGSVIRPAAYCGVIGYKPSQGVAPRAGIKQNSDLLDEVGVFARSVEDAALAASVLAAKPAWKDLPHDGQRGASPIIGWYPPRRPTPPRRRCWPRSTTCIGIWCSAAHVVPRSPGRACTTAFLPRNAMCRCSRRRARWRRVLVSTRPVVGPADRTDRAGTWPVDRRIPGRAAIAARLHRRHRQPVRRGRRDHHAERARRSAQGHRSTGDPVFNRPWHLLGCPMMNLPVPASLGHGESGLPLGVSLVGRPGEDARLWAAAGWIENKLRVATETYVPPRMTEPLAVAR